MTISGKKEKEKDKIQCVYHATRYDIRKKKSLFSQISAILHNFFCRTVLPLAMVQGDLLKCFIEL